MAQDIVSIPQPRRFDNPLSPDLTDKDVDYILDFEPFRSLDAAKFPKGTGLRAILANDTRFIKGSDGDIVFRQGDYGSSAFVILKGSVHVILGKDEPSAGGRPKGPERKGWWDSLAQLWRNNNIPEVRGVNGESQQISHAEQMESGRARLMHPEQIRKSQNTIELKQGEVFGEIAALSRTPRVSTVFTGPNTQLLEIRWQGLRDIRRYDDAFRKHVDNLYRERSLKSHLRQLPLFAHLEDEVLSNIADQTTFATYGDFDWYPDYKGRAMQGAANRLDHEPVIAMEGHYVNSVVMVRSGFARVSVKVNHGHHTISYMGKGGMFGLRETAHHWRYNETLPFQQTLRAVGYVDVLLVPANLIEELVIPKMPADQIPHRIIPRESAHQPWLERSLGVNQGLMDFIVDERFNNGSAAMLIDLNRCTGCDDCVRACANAHDNNPRFIRHGKRFGQYMVANACLHCVDPVCMIGCPTGAIHRSPSAGEVIINQSTCIGCSSCANNCPYSNIRMVSIRDKTDTAIFSRETLAPIQKATKCDLCVDQSTGPACQNACPHDALARMDMSNIPALSKWTRR